ncbi:MAG: flavodoxin family protein [Pirellulaceae bacterium]|jgi:multimeric flavodoxin WrbA|nr:flavodoxin family protein [Pirellulaceae bacterium]
MVDQVTRRRFVTTVGAGAAFAAGSAVAAPAPSDLQAPAVKIIAVACSPRRGKTTAQALNICLQAAKDVAPERIEVELIDLGGLKIPAELAAGLPLAPGERDDFPAVAEKLAASQVAAIVVGTPVYFANMSALCKAFLDRCGVFRKNNFALAGKVGAVLAVGAVRSGGQELVIQSVQASLFCHEMLVVGDGRPTGHFGARLWNDGADDISQDEFGVGTAKNLGRHVAEVVLARQTP